MLKLKKKWREVLQVVAIAVAVVLILHGLGRLVGAETAVSANAQTPDPATIVIIIDQGEQLEIKCTSGEVGSATSGGIMWVGCESD